MKKPDSGKLYDTQSQSFAHSLFTGPKE